jgi:hypothetical protein
LLTLITFITFKCYNFSNVTKKVSKVSNVTKKVCKVSNVIQKVSRVSFFQLNLPTQLLLVFFNFE